MKRRHAVLAAVAVAAVAAVAASAALAGGFGRNGMRPGNGHGAGPCTMPGEGPGMAMGAGMHGGPGGLGLPLHRLDLTEAQRDAIRAIVEEAQPNLHALRETLAEGRRTFQAAHPPTEVDEAAIRAHVAAQAATMADIAVAMAHVRARALATLTEEQRAKAAELRSNVERRIDRGMRRRGM